MLRKVGFTGTGLGAGYLYKEKKSECEASVGGMLCLCGGTFATLASGLMIAIGIQESKINEEGMDLLMVRAQGGDPGAMVCVAGIELAHELDSVTETVKKFDEVPDCAMMYQLMTPGEDQKMEEKTSERIAQMGFHVLSELMISRGQVDDKGIYPTLIPPMPPGILPTKVDDDDMELLRYVGSDYARFFLMDMARRTYNMPPHFDQRAANAAMVVSAVRGFSPFYYSLARNAIEDGDVEGAANYFHDFVVANAVPRQREEVTRTLEYISRKEDKSSAWRDIQHLLWTTQIGSAQAELHQIALHDGITPTGLKRAPEGTHKKMLSQMLHSSSSVGSLLEQYLKKNDPILKIYPTAINSCKRALNDEDLKASEACVEGLRLVTDYLRVAAVA